ncbi:glyoxalase [Zobellella denitrificans]|uniref:VOC family protein n=1 Tax=Zobellella denitrificans TaxID=347534 RepID=UPI000B8C4D29|nr:VOC family protein [Zobellella denitrificans]OXS15328.1 glyoxalase [Zobellella denitrificans]
MASSSLGLQQVKVIALAVSDKARAERFYAEVLGLAPATEGGEAVGFQLGEVTLLLKDDWYGRPTAEPNPRLTLACDHAPDTEARLRERGVTIADPVALYDDLFHIGSFLDSEGNKLWFCSPRLS